MTIIILNRYSATFQNPNIYRGQAQPALTEKGIGAFEMDSFVDPTFK